MDEPAVQTELDSDARIGEDDETLELFSVLCHRDDVILVVSAFGWQCKRCKINFDFSSGKSMENHLNAAHNIVTNAEQTPKVPPSSSVDKKPIVITRQKAITQNTFSTSYVKEKPTVIVTGWEGIPHEMPSSSSVKEKEIVVTTEQEIISHSTPSYSFVEKKPQVITGRGIVSQSIESSSSVKENPIVVVTRREGILQNPPSPSVKEKPTVIVTRRESISQETASSSSVNKKPVVVVTRREGIPQKTPFSVKEKPSVIVAGVEGIAQNSASSSSVNKKHIVVVTRREVTPQSSNSHMSARMDGTAVDSSASFGWSRKRTFKAIELGARDSVAHKKSKNSCDKAEETNLTVSDTNTKQITSIRPLTQDEKLVNITSTDQKSEGRGTSGVWISEADMKLVSASNMTPVVVLPKVNMKPVCTIRKRNISFSPEKTLDTKTEQKSSSAVKTNQIKVICRPQNKETVQSLGQKKLGFSSKDKVNQIKMLPLLTAKDSSDYVTDVSLFMDKYVAALDPETTVSEIVPTDNEKIVQHADYEKMKQNFSVQSVVRAEGTCVESDIAQAVDKNTTWQSEIVQEPVSLTDTSSQMDVHHQTLSNVDKIEELQISGNTTVAVAFSEHEWAAENLSHIENATGDGALVAPAEWEVKVDYNNQSNIETSTGTEESYVPVGVTEEKQVMIYSVPPVIEVLAEGAELVQNVQDPRLIPDLVSSSHGTEEQVDVEPWCSLPLTVAKSDDSSSLPNERRQSDKHTLSDYDSTTPAFHQIKECSFCHHSFNDSESLLKHTRRYQNQKPVQCKVCQRKFHNLDLLNIHIFYDHDNDSTPQCLTCCQKYPSKVSLVEHMVKEHSASKGLTRPKLRLDSLAVEKCTVCNINIRSLPKVVRYHYRLHRMRKEFTCKVCGERFKRLYLMHTHFQLEHSKDDRGRRLFAETDEETKRLIKDLLDEENESHIRKSASGTETQRSYFCSLCKKDVTATRRAFLKHLMRHYGTKASREVEMHPDKPYECPDCGEEVPNVGDMVNYHRLTHGHVDNENVKLKCTFCSAYFVNEGTRKRHERLIHFENSHAKKETFMCEFCAKVFMSKYSLKIHQKLHNEKEGNFTCDFCYKSFRYKSQMETHRAKHGTKEGTMLCPHCRKEYMSKYSLDRHVTADHLGVKDYKYKCKLCPKQYYSSRHLRDHVATKHEGKRPYPCKLCDATFLCFTTRKRHMRRDHVEHDPLVCSVCQETFTEKHLLTRHESVAHKGVEPFACQFCQKAFSCPTSLKNHVNMHRGIRPFLCEDCGMGFVTNSELQRHRSTHCRVGKPTRYKVPFIESTALVADSQG